MTQAELEKRRDRADRETFIIKKTEEGHRVYTPGNPARNYLVVADLDSPSCTCPDFTNHARDPEWRCKHVLAVANHLGVSREPADDVDPVEADERAAIQEESRRSEAARSNGRGPSQMLLKRSVSPDGRIDSLSVEFSCSTQEQPTEEVRRRARRVLELQSAIVDEFLNTGGGTAPRSSRDGDEQAVEARMLRVGGLDTRWGRRLYINIEVNGDTLKLFGSRKQLSEAIEAAGYPNRADNVEEGARLDLLCRVTTRPSEDGRYVNIDTVLPAASRPAVRKSAR
jgi:hypothetical protein